MYETYNEKKADALIAEYREWYKVNNIPLSKQGLLLEADKMLDEDITDDQRTYILDYMRRWDRDVYSQ